MFHHSALLASTVGWMRTTRPSSGLKKLSQNAAARWLRSKARLWPISWATLLFATIAFGIWYSALACRWTDLRLTRPHVKQARRTQSYWTLPNITAEILVLR